MPRPASLALAALPSLLAACGAPAADADIPVEVGVDAQPSPPLPPSSGLALLSGVEAGVSVSLLHAATGEVAREACIGSGSEPPDNGPALSTSLVLASGPDAGHRLVVIDQTSRTVTWVDPATCVVVGQLDVSASLPSTPVDVTALSATKAYVTRASYDGTALGEQGDGDDLLIIDPSRRAITGRIALADHAVAIDDREALSWPSSPAVVGTTLFVPMVTESRDSMVSGAGRVVMVDTERDRVVGHLDLPGLHGCNGVSYRADSQTLAVSCGGRWREAGVDIATAAVVLFDARVSPPVETTRLTAASFAGRAPGYFMAASGDVLGFVIVHGDIEGRHRDAIWQVDTDRSAPRLLGRSAGNYGLGVPLVDVDRRRVLVTDRSSSRGVVIYQYGDPAAPALVATIDGSPSGDLPATQLARY